MTPMNHSQELVARSSLLRRFMLVFGLLVGGSLLVSGVSSLYFSYKQNRDALIALEREKAHSAAAQIGQYITDIEQRIALTSTRRTTPDVLKKRMGEVELLSQIPAITEIRLLDHRGQERLKVSRLATDVIDSGRDYSGSDFFKGVSPGRPFRSAVHFVRDTEPYITIAMAVGPERAGVTVAEVNLGYLLDGIRRIKIGEKGYAYVVDSLGKLIAHPDLNLVRGRSNLSNLPQVTAALSHASDADFLAAAPVSIDGQPVLSAYEKIPQLDWLVFAEQPEEEVFAPLYESVVRAALMLLVGLICALIASMLVVRKMVGPIRALRRGAQAIATGSLDQRIDVKTGDELEDLAGQFNQMASQLQATYSDLQLARQVAEAASRQKSDFLAMMSHEMRTPLGGVIGMLGLALRDGQLFIESRRQIELARSNAQSLLVIINDVLDVAKIEAGKLSVEIVDFDLLDLIQEAMAAVCVRAQDKDLILQADLPPDLPRYLRGDPTRIRQVILNLLGNAVKFTERGEVRLALRAIERRGSAAKIEFSIIDTGPGIEAEALGRLFQKFEQADLSTTRRYGGTGLGLAICKELVQLMGGEIDVRSEVGKGSTFRFLLPLQLGKKPKLREGESEDRRHSHRLSILCAEDGVTNQIIIRALLEEMGHEVEIAEHGLEALKALSERDFDLVLMDGRMPYMDGEEASRRIRAGGKGDIRVRSTDVSIVALTANASREDRDRYLAAGMDGFLSKPIDERHLFEEIGRVITALLRSGHRLMPMPTTASEPMVLGPPTIPGPLTMPGGLDVLFAGQEVGLPPRRSAPQAAIPRALATPHSPALMARIAAAFVDDAPQRLKAAYAGVNAGDAHAAILEIHSLRGAAGHACLPALQKELEVLEKLAEAGDLAAVSEGLQQVEYLLIQGMASLNQWVSRPGNE